MSGGKDVKDVVEKAQIFLAKRDGIDKVVKTGQYVTKFIHWNLQRRNTADALAWAARVKSLERSCSTSRKAFRLGKFLAGFNALRTTRPTSRTAQICCILANAGEMVYFFFDHFIWLSRVGFLDPKLEELFTFISASGEALGYVFAILGDLLVVSSTVELEKSIVAKYRTLKGSQKKNDTPEETVEAEFAKLKAQLAAARLRRLNSILSIAANSGDLVIALSDILPGSHFGHAVALTLGGLTSAWVGAYKNWPAN